MSAPATAKSEVFTPAVVVGKVDKVPQGAPRRRSRGLPICPHSNRGYTDVSHSERRNGSFVCGDCGQRFPIATEDSRKDIVIVPSHRITPALHRYRLELERQARSRL